MTWSFDPDVTESHGNIEAYNTFSNSHTTITAVIPTLILFKPHLWTISSLYNQWYNINNSDVRKLPFTLNPLVWSSCSIFQHIPKMVITTRFIWGQWGYIYYICGFARHDISSVELIARWYKVVQQSMEVSTVLPPSTVRRGRPIPEGIIF